jgi:hypothetical protein
MGSECTLRVGGVVSPIMTSTMSWLLVSTAVTGSVWVTVSVTTVVPSGKSAFGVTALSSSNAIPAASHRKLVSGSIDAMTPSTMDAVPSNVTSEPSVAEHSSGRSSAASATTTT